MQGIFFRTVWLCLGKTLEDPTKLTTGMDPWCPDSSCRATSFIQTQRRLHSVLAMLLLSCCGSHCFSIPFSWQASSSCRMQKVSE